MTWPLFQPRYESLIPEFQSFMAALDNDLPIGLRLNNLCHAEDVTQRFLNDFEKKMSRPFSEVNFYEVEGERKEWGGRLEHHLGLYYMQAMSSLLPVLALGLERGDHILDLCSAPGGKSAFIAELMNGSGSLVCNEPDLNRRRVLKANLERMGVPNAAVMGCLGENLPFKAQSFDKILLDGPCSSEGTLRKVHLGMKKRKLGNFISYNESFRKQLQETQAMLLDKAYDLLKPGGTLIYSTCTYDPDENEAQVNKVIENHTDMEIKPCHFPEEIDEKLCEGVVSYGTKTFHSSLRLTRRVYPHYIDSIGFYIAKIVKR